MNNDIIISAYQVTKNYKLYDSPIDRLKEVVHPFGKKYHKNFFALRDVSIEIKKGETVGIVGSNGSGKSTLLKIITGVLTPTTGSVNVGGKISALLELGAGFNPELTGLENIYFNGALSGLTKQEVEKHLDDILSFADIGAFIYQPVKIYSSGMFIRLAFATAININPDILIVDEALAVGDAKFQQKCFNKIKNFQDDGKTILVVTHDTSAITKYCTKAIFLQDGRVVDIGEPNRITKLYTDLLFTGNVDGYSAKPKLIEINYYNFNIIHYQRKYFGVSCDLGEVDFGQFTEEEFFSFTNDKNILYANSIMELKLFIDGIGLEKMNLEAGSATEALNEANKNELDRFLSEYIELDGCIERKTYNKNEYRLGNGKARILDYFLTVDEKSECFNILSGSYVSLYLKTIFVDEVTSPNFGFAIKALGGVLVYGTNTDLMHMDITAVSDRLISVVKFKLKLDLNNGDYFIDVGVGNTSHEALDWRGDLIHFVVHGLSNYTFTGLVDCKTEFSKVNDNKEINSSE
jgi:ABC-type polysaccharide/polyol phosphate transport system ATPase subunit